MATIASGRAASASAYGISGSGFAIAKMIGRGAIRLSIAGVTAPAILTPTNTSAPSSASDSVRAEVGRRNGTFHSLSPLVRPSCSTPWLSHSSRCCGLTPISM